MSVQVLRHPQTQEVGSVGNPYLAPLGCGLFTPLYFLFKGNWRHVASSLFFGLMSLGLSSFVYLFMVFRLNETHLRRRGYVDEESQPSTSYQTKRKIGFVIGFLIRLPFGIAPFFDLQAFSFLDRQDFSSNVGSSWTIGIIVGVVWLVVWLISRVFRKPS